MKTRPLASMESLTAAQLQDIALWLESSSYTKVSARVEGQFGVKVSRSSLARFFQRDATRRLLAERGQLASPAAPFLEFAARGEATFDQAALELLQQQALQQAVTVGTPRETLQLKQLFGIIHHTRALALRQRLAAVRERSAALRERALALKAQIATLRPAPQPAPPSEAQPRTPAPSPAAAANNNPEQINDLEQKREKPIEE